jgi:serine/threonine-protein kinase RsbW
MFPMVCMALPEVLHACDDLASFCIASTPLAVRHGLKGILDHPAMGSLSDATRGNAELVLAEALNNIVEHAYDSEDGQIDVQLRWFADRICCNVVDAGLPMPNGDVPQGLAQPIGGNQDLAEGGYGWFLIRALTTDLTYRRIDARNHLSFQLNIEQ